MSTHGRDESSDHLVEDLYQTIMVGLINDVILPAGKLYPSSYSHVDESRDRV